MTGGTSIQAWARYRFGATTIEVVTDEAVDGRWLSEFVTPWFGSGESGNLGSRVRMTSSDARYAALEARLATTAVAEIPCFDLDSALLSYPGWTEQDGTTLVHDAKFGCFLGLGHSQGIRQVEVVARSGDRRARIGLLRAAREIVTLRARMAPMLDLHAAGFVWRGRAVLIAGDKNAGKTTLLSHALASLQTALLANDRVMVAGDRALGVPTVVSVREFTRRVFPGISVGLPAKADLLAVEELASLRMPEAQAGERLMLSPAQFARQLGSAVVASAPVGAVVFPEVVPAAEGWSLQSLAPTQGVARLRDCLYGRHTGPRVSTCFQRLVAGEPTTELQEALVEGLAAKIPLVRCLLGPDVYRDSALGWLNALPMADGDSGS